MLIKDYDVDMIQDRECLCFEVADSENFVPRFIKAFPIAINSISMHRPTLDDVFLKLTGREIRDQEAGALDSMRAFARAWRPSGRH